MTEPPRLLARDDELWVLYKPAGLAVHATGLDEPDLVSWALSEGAPQSLAAIHRLDRGASGLVLCSPSSELRAQLGELFATSAVRKTYQALVHGRTHAKGAINRPLQDPRRKRKVAARTRYWRIATHGSFTHVRVQPDTGRHHQIRRHLHGIGHPLVGDERYKPRRFRAVPAFPGRLWLAAVRLELPDGRSFEAPLAPELAAHLEALAARSS